MTDGRYELLAPADEKVYAYLRRADDETLVVLCNFSDEEVAFELPAEVTWDASELVISNEPDAAAELTRTVTLAPYAAHVYAIR